MKNRRTIINFKIHFQIYRKQAHVIFMSCISLDIWRLLIWCEIIDSHLKRRITHPCYNYILIYHWKLIIENIISHSLAKICMWKKRVSESRLNVSLPKFQKSVNWALVYTWQKWNFVTFTNQGCVELQIFGLNYPVTIPFHDTNWIVL